MIGLKAYFSDGLLKVAIALSLLRADLDLYFGPRSLQYRAPPGFHEILQGPLFAYTQTDFHTRDRFHLGNDIRPKGIDLFRTDDIFRDLHSLADYRRFDGVQTNVATWLVNGPEPQLPPVERRQDGEMPGGASVQPPAGGAGGGVGGEGAGFSSFFGSELTKEDMDLIDVLWRQDIDLGMARGAFDDSRLQQLNEENPHSGVREGYQDARQVSTHQNTSILAGSAIDSETGEPMSPTVMPSTASDSLQGLSSRSMDMDALQGDTIEESWEDVVSILNDPIISGGQDSPLLPYNDALTADDEVDSVYSPVLEQGLDHFPASSHLEADLDPYDEPMSSVLYQDVSLATIRLDDSQPILQSRSESSAMPQRPPLVDDAADDAMFSPPLSPLFSLSANPPPFFDLTHSFLEDVDDASDKNSTFGEMDEAVEEALDRLAVGDIMEGLTVGLYDNDDVFLQEILHSGLTGVNFDDDFDPDVTEFDFDMFSEHWSTDSAVSSMASPNQLRDGSYGGAMSPTDSVDDTEGATGGKQEIKQEDLERYAQYDIHDAHQSRTLHTNSSTNNTQPWRPPTAAATSKHVHHNHSYYLQPGQVSREEREAEARREKEERATRSRDDKRAKALRLPFTVDEIIDLPVERFTEMLARHALTESQLQLVRDIRRRGKNKAAAQNCRKRKLEVIQALEREVEGLRVHKDRARREKGTLARSAAELKEKFARLQGELLRTLRDAEGRRYDPSAYTLQRTADGDIILVPREETGAAWGGAASTAAAEESENEDKAKSRRKPKRKD